MTHDEAAHDGFSDYIKYTGAEEYDQENVWDAADDFYLALAKEIGGPVLDVACGTGRLTRAIAAAGIETVGIDLGREMLDRACILDTTGAVEWILGDVRTMQLNRRFRLLLMTSHAFQHMVTAADLEAFFARVREHLEPDGVFAFETRDYTAKTFGGSEEPTLWHSFQDANGRWIDVLIGARFDSTTGVEQLEEIRVVRETGEREHLDFVLRYIPVDELNNLLHTQGFEIVEQYGDWQKEPPGPDQPEVITICRLAAEPTHG
ncbi:MAG TPA: class I SAM-dependent methyltransferase [Nitrolancea sp.]